MKFQYTALDAKGEEHVGIIEEDNAALAVRSLRRAGFYPTKIDKTENSEAPKPKLEAPKPIKEGCGANYRIIKRTKEDEPYVVQQRVFWCFWRDCIQFKHLEDTEFYIDYLRKQKEEKEKQNTEEVIEEFWI